MVMKLQALVIQVNINTCCDLYCKMLNKIPSISLVSIKLFTLLYHAACLSSLSYLCHCSTHDLDLFGYSSAYIVLCYFCIIVRNIWYKKNSCVCS